MAEPAWKILLIDDDEDDYLLTRTMLGEARGRKFELEWAGSFAAGRKALGLDDPQPSPCASEYHAVLVDYDLGARSGIELIRAAAQSGCTAPLILFTGRGSYDVDLEAMQAGATLYLTKDEAKPLLLERAIRYAVEMKHKTTQVQERELELLKTNEALHMQESALLAREAILESVIESAQGPVWAVDRDYRLAMANGDFQREAEAALGKPIPTGASMVEAWVTPQTGTEFWRAAYDRALAGEKVREELVLQAPTGEKHYREYIFNPIFGPDGAVTGAACFARDITSIRAAQVDLADFLESTHDSFFALDREWRIIFANRRFAQITGQNPVALVGKNFWEVFPKYRGNEVEQRYREAMETQTPIHFQAGGYYSTQWYDISIYPNRNGLSIFASDRSHERQALEALRSSESRYRAFFENLRDLVQVLELVWDANGEAEDWIWRDANPPALAVLGAPREAVVGSRATERLDRAFIRRLLPGYARVEQTGEPLEYEINFGERDYVVTVFRMEANLLGSSAADITDRKRAELELRQNQAALLENEARLRERNAALRQSENRLRRMFETSIIGIVTRDLAGNIFGANDAFLSLLGYTREAFFAAPRNINALIPEEYRPVEAQIVAEVLETGASKPHEKEFIRADGGRVPALVGHTLLEGGDRTAPAPGWQSQPIPQGKMAAQRSAGEQEQAADLQPADQQPAPADHQPLADNPQQAADSLPANGSHAGEIIGFVIDMTELNAARQSLEEYAEKLKRSNQELEQFAFIASHDLQEPLRKIQSFAEIIDRDLAGKTDQRTHDHLERMRSAAGRMQDLIRDLLELSRVNTRGQPFVKVDLNQTAGEVVSDLEGLIERTGGQVQVAQLPTIEADPLQMRQLLQNLIGNALKFHKPDEPPRVMVSASTGQLERKNGASRKRGDRRAPDKVTLTIQDNGIGFESEYFERILEPFQRLHGRSEYEGTGIGLAICKQIINRHHGQIAAESTPGEGSRFIITLPVRQEA